MKVLSIALHVQIPDGWTVEDAEDHIAQLINDRNMDGSEVLSTEFYGDISDTYHGVDGVMIAGIELDVKVPASWTYDTLEDYVRYLCNEVDSTGLAIVRIGSIMDVSDKYEEYL